MTPVSMRFRAVAFLLAVALASGRWTAGAATLTTCDEPSLRAAMEGGGYITIACDGVIALSAPLVIERDMTLDATGRRLTLSGEGVLRPLTVNPGVQFGMTGVAVANGFSSFQAGGLLNHGLTRLVDCSFSNNVASGDFALGGAIYQGAGPLSIERCLFDHNHAIASGQFLGSGGALSGGYLSPGTGPIEIVNSTFTANSASTSGGAIAIHCPTTEANGPVSILHCTIAGNTNGGIVHCDERGIMTVRGSILADNHGSNAQGALDEGYNISSDFSDGFANPLSLHHTDPRLAALADHGGPTWTMALSPDSPAIDAGNAEFCPQTDQRSVARPYGDNCDIGSYEATPAPSDVRFAQARFYVSEDAGHAVISVVRDDGAQEPGTVQFSALAGSASASSDFVLTNGTLEFFAGQTVGIFEVALVDDSEIEGSETIGLSLSNPTGGVSLGLGTQATLFIIDDEVQVVSECEETALRQAMALGGPIRFACDGTLLLTAPLVVERPTTLDAGGRVVVLSGQGQTRVLHVRPGVLFTLMGVNIHDGWDHGSDGPAGRPGSRGMGGAIWSEGAHLTLVGCSFQNNRAWGGHGGEASPGANDDRSGGEAAGGAIYALGGSFHASDCFFLENQATGGTGANSSQISFLGFAGGSARGGALVLKNTDGVLKNCVLGGNRAMGGSPGVAQSGNSGTAGSAWGGALFVGGGVTEISQCDFQTNSTESAFPDGPLSGAGGTTAGGAFLLESGTMTVDESNFQANRAVGGSARRFSLPGLASGGAIHNQGTLKLLRGRLVGNVVRGGSGGGGGEALGGAFQNDGLSVIAKTLFENNSAYPGISYRGSLFGGTQVGAPRGGGIANRGSLSLEASTLAWNHAHGAEGGLGGGGPIPGAPAFGGGLYNAGSFSGTNNTLVGNCSVGGTFPISTPDDTIKGGDAFGGGLYNAQGTALLVHHTFDANQAQGGSGHPSGLGLGGALGNADGMVTLVNSILSASTGGGNCFGLLNDGGHNISSDASCLLTPPGSFNQTEPFLGPLDDYGGPTPTVPLLAGSPALEAADPAWLPATDQRGRLRPSGAGGDIGAFESSPPYTIRGTLTGYHPNPVPVQIGVASTPTDNQGRFRLDDLAPASYTVRPGDARIVFVPHSRGVDLGPDAVNLNFSAYQTNALTPERLEEFLRFTYAGADNQPVDVDLSLDLIGWDPDHSAPQTSADGIHQWMENPLTNSPPRFYRAQKR